MHTNFHLTPAEILIVRRLEDERRHYALKQSITRTANALGISPESVMRAYQKQEGEGA